MKFCPWLYNVMQKTWTLCHLAGVNLLPTSYSAYFRDASHPRQNFPKCAQKFPQNLYIPFHLDRTKFLKSRIFLQNFTEVRKFPGNWNLCHFKLS